MIREIEREIERIKAELVGLGPIHPGSLSEQYNVCGNPGCRCKDPKNPKKHGPYVQLSYTWLGRSRSAFVRAPSRERVEAKVSAYKRFRDLTQRWVDLEIEREKLERKRGD